MQASGPAFRLGVGRSAPATNRALGSVGWLWGRAGLDCRLSNAEIEINTQEPKRKREQKSDQSEKKIQIKELLNGHGVSPKLSTGTRSGESMSLSAGCQGIGTLGRQWFMAIEKPACPLAARQKPARSTGEGVQERLETAFRPFLSMALGNGSIWASASRRCEIRILTHAPARGPMLPEPK